MVELLYEVLTALILLPTGYITFISNQYNFLTNCFFTLGFSSLTSSMNATCPRDRVTVTCNQSYSGSLTVLQWLVSDVGNVGNAVQESFLSLTSVSLPVMGHGITFGGVMFETIVLSIEPTLVSTLMYTATRELNRVEVSCTVVARQGSDSMVVRQDLIIAGVGKCAMYI